ncbi:MAG: PAS domain-containing protein, partial [Lachnospiraceae bacterium]|nr:PAS domain-containing protein [Lachnospiraceae bacterium]
MKKSIFYKLIYICLIALIISGAVSAFILQHNYEENIINELTQVLNTAVLGTNSKDAKYLSSITDNNRITVIDLYGNVLSDSHNDNITENHSLRPEVSSALKGDIGVSKRQSATLGKDMLYIAMRYDNSVYRIAVEAGGVDRSFLQLIPAIAFGITIACIVAVLLSGGISNSLIAPLMEVNENVGRIKRKEYDRVCFKPSKYEEINSITHAIDIMLEEVSGYIEDISIQNDKMEFILNNMGQGMILVDEDTTILHSNRYAHMLFKAKNSFVGLSLEELTGDNKISTRVQECIESDTSRVFDFPMDAGVFSVAIRPLHTGWQKNGAYIIITDVSELRGRQKLRQEFVDGVVHDLRNPIASIGENAQALSKSLSSNQEHKEALDKITTQSKHMQEVIDNLLILNVLDEAKDIAQKPPVNVYDICKTVEERLLTMSKEMALSVTIDGNKNTLAKV